MKTFCLILALIISVAAGVQAAENLAATIPMEPTVYLAHGANACMGISGLEYWIFLHSPADDDFIRINLDLDLQGLSITTPVVIPEAGVTQLSYDVSALPYHFDVVWMQQTLDHVPLIKLQFLSDPNLGGLQTPVNVVLERVSGGTEAGLAMESFAGCCWDCLDCFHSFYMENHFKIPVGASAVIPFEWDWFCHSAGGAYFEAVDTEGWVVSWEPDHGFSWETCGLCYQTRYPGSISVAIPTGVAIGTISTVTLTGADAEAVFIIEALEPVPVENTSWGRIKALYN
jgi:hypothetical protein